MALQLHICFLVLAVMGMTDALVTEDLVVIEGQTLIIKCSVDDGNITYLEWKNPHGFVIYFNSQKGLPKLETTEHEEKTAIKCTADANYPPAKISWLFENGLEINAPPQYHCNGNPGKCSSVNILLVQSHKRNVPVKCIVRHRALHNSHLISFISIKKDRETSASVEVTTETEFTNTSTNYSTGVGQDEWNKRDGERQSSSALIFLVTCLILGLLVVVIFVVIKLRKAHVLWKIENDNSDQSLESNKSKSSHEDKQERKLQISVINPGFRNTNFARYIVEEPPHNERAANAENKETTEIQRDKPNPRVQKESAQIRETEL
ncbi:hypothetical protein JZ751_022772 [Albula glossodonta]|uniref:Ig-like domain-containing protein n=1 Tax=Albula glossodonta TaxID=121402 RepID=A0A8T2PK13_9TELE|nr:hypothetical protein JZ751_022772 [Albula glossodonta]